MSLDVYLYSKEPVESKKPSSGIFIREDGKTIEISEEEWHRRNPGIAPVRARIGEQESNHCVYTDNITHNLAEMAAESLLYEPLWTPHEIGITTAKQLRTYLTHGLLFLHKNPERYKKFNPKNGWGNYEGLVRFVENYLEACNKYPEATIEISR